MNHTGTTPTQGNLKGSAALHSGLPANIVGSGTPLGRVIIRAAEKAGIRDAGDPSSATNLPGLVEEMANQLMQFRAAAAGDHVVIEADVWDSFISDYNRYVDGDLKMPFSELRLSLASVITNASRGTGPAAVRDQLRDDQADRSDAARLIAEIASAARQMGIYNGEVALTGPMAIQLLRDLAKHGPSTAAASVPHQLTGATDQATKPQMRPLPGRRPR